MIKLTKKQAAVRLGVGPETVRHWEASQTQPPIERIPAIVRFLGYVPFPEPESISERLLAKRRAMGWSIRKAAAQIGVDPTTWQAWECAKDIVRPAHRALVARLLTAVHDPVSEMEHPLDVP
jgi:transcriptional regulator with XRE-family HTH domain